MISYSNPCAHVNQSECTWHKRKKNMYKKFSSHFHFLIKMQIFLINFSLTSLSMTFSTYSNVCIVGSPVVGSGTSSVRWIIFSSSTVSFSLTVSWPGRSFIAIRGNFKRLLVVDFVVISSSLDYSMSVYFLWGC